MNNNLTNHEKQNEFVDEMLQTLKNEYQKPTMSEKQFDELLHRMEEAKMENKKNKRNKMMIRCTSAAAAFAGAFIVLMNSSATIAQAVEQIPVIGSLVDVVVFRNYEYESERNKATIEVPEVKPEAPHTNPELQENLEKSTDEINAEIQKITAELVNEFEENLQYEYGYQDVIVKSEILATTDDYFTLKLLCYQGAGSGYQWNYYYTIDLHTGERLKLRDLFQEDADFITPISDNIKEQMQAQMDKDEQIYYWLNDEIEAMNFKSITEDVNFYINEDGNIVIGFNEGDVAPMYMGTVEFEIPSDIVKDIRK
ncbi:MAG: RsiV family protein [bacterium]|nr:RsiV family protein [bacterium]